MADLPERIVAWYFEHRKDKPMWLDASSGHGGTEYVRADIYAKELSQLAIESKDRELALARLEGEVNALRKLCSDKSCNHAWDREWRDELTGRIFRNCVICGVKIEVP